MIVEGVLLAQMAIIVFLGFGVHRIQKREASALKKFYHQCNATRKIERTLYEAKSTISMQNGVIENMQIRLNAVGQPDWAADGQAYMKRGEGNE